MKREYIAIEKAKIDEIKYENAFYKFLVVALLILSLAMSIKGLKLVENYKELEQEKQYQEEIINIQNIKIKELGG